jgi:hypothetical protein
LETETLLRSIREASHPKKSPKKSQNGKLFARRKKKTKSKKKKVQVSASEPDLRAAVRGATEEEEEPNFGKSQPLSAVDRARKREAAMRDMSFEAEEKRVRQGVDQFMPSTKVDERLLEQERRAMQEELSRLASLEQAQDDEAARTMDNRVERERRTNFVKEDIAVNQIQRMYRGHIGRRKFDVTSKVEEASHGWTEVRDEEAGERWFYNSITGESQWEPPAELISQAELMPKPPKHTPNGASILDAGEEFFNETASQASRPSSSASLPPLESTNERNELLDSLMSTQDSFSTSDQRPQSTGGMPRNLPPLATAPRVPGPEAGSDRSYTGEEEEEEDDVESEGEDEMGDMMGNTTPRLFLADGTKNMSFRATVQSALNVSKYDSVSTLLAAGPTLSGSSSFKATDKQTGGARMVAVMANAGKGKGKKTKRAKGFSSMNSSETGPPPIHEVADPGYTLDGNDTSKIADDAEELVRLEPDMLGKLVKPTREVCFLCWSASRNAKCGMHHKYAGHIIKAEDSALVCGNWELDSMRRKYRAEEIQEIFMKQSQSLKWNKTRKCFQKVTELKHPIYKAIDAQIGRENERLWRKVHVRRWLRSFIDKLRVGKVPGTESSATPKLLRLKNTLSNYKWVQRYTNQVRDGRPRPPITERMETREVKYCVCIDPDPPHNMLIHGGGEGRAAAPRFTKPLELYRPRPYPLPAPRSIPMPEPSYEEELPLPIPNVYMDEREKHSWLERMCARTAVAGMNCALIQVEACTPPRNYDKLKRTKYPPPITIKFANFSRKPNPPQNMSVGGLCAELTITQLVSTYVPPQFGGFTVTDRRSFAPTANRELIFKSLQCPDIMAKYVKRPLEHILNVRRAPTITCSTSAKPETIAKHPHLAEEEEEGAIDEEGHLVHGNDVLELFCRHYHGQNRPEQTGEDKSNGFRTTMSVEGLASDAETMALTFTPTVDVATPNMPSANRSENTHADRFYPFCEPTNRDNTTLDFFHLLLGGKSSRNQGQIFTVLGWQDPGLFGMKCDLEGPLGAYNCIVYRSWAFHQDSLVEEFLTDDGVPYWYDRKTGETFWERPLLDQEEVRGTDGGVDGTVVDGEGESATLGMGVAEAPYTQKDMRKYMLKKLEDQDDIDLRYKALALYEQDNPRPGADMLGGGDGQNQGGYEDTHQSRAGTLVRVREDGMGGRRVGTTGEVLGVSGPTTIPGEQLGVSTTAGAADGKGYGTHPGRSVMYAADKPGDDTVCGGGGGGGCWGSGGGRGGGSGGGGGGGGGGRPGGPGVRGAGGENLPANTQELVTSITAALGGVLEQMGGNVSGQELLQLGLGLGMGLGMKHPSALSPTKAAKAKMLPGGGGAGKADGVSRLPDIGTLYHGMKAPPSLEELEQAEEEARLEAEASGKKVEEKVKPSATPDEEDLDVDFTTHQPAGLGKSFVDKPPEGEPSTQHLVPGTDGHLRNCKAIIPEGFIQSITATHTASQSVDYLPYFPNLNEAQSVGCVKPRQAVEDWLAIGFDPWSAGKEPLTTQFIEDLAAEIGKENDEDGGDGGDGGGGGSGVAGGNRNKPELKFADLSGLDELKDRQTQENKDEQDLERLETWCRHGKYKEIEDQLDDPNWTLPIDAKDIHGNTLLLIAAQNGNKRIAKLSMRRGAEINQQNVSTYNTNYTALVITSNFSNTHFPMPPASSISFSAGRSERAALLLCLRL